ncbi:hypothetical protein A2U01_0050890, partial [Trifolium medium]|nr:hypothetical protein [Trifolium medium]
LWCSVWVGLATTLRTAIVRAINNIVAGNHQNVIAGSCVNATPKLKETIQEVRIMHI